MALMKIEPPRLEGLGLRERTDRIGDWCQRITEQLRFVLSSLAGENFNGNGFSLEILTPDGKQDLGGMGQVPGGVGLRSGDVILRVSGAGVEVSKDGGKTWTEVATV